MSNNKTKNHFLIQSILHGMLEKKAENIIHIDLQKLDVSVADGFIICHADNDKQVTAIAESVVDEVKKYIKERPHGIEGKREAEWILIDYINIVVHIFIKEKRALYGIEDLWSDGIVKEIKDNYALDLPKS